MMTFHQQANVLVKQMVQNLTTMLCQQFLNIEDKDVWDGFLAKCLHAYNFPWHELVQKPLFYLMQGYFTRSTAVNVYVPALDILVLPKINSNVMESRKVGVEIVRKGQRPK